MIRFKLGGSGSKGGGIGWLNNQYFAKAGEIFETDDPVMITALRNSKLAVELAQEPEPVEVIQPVVEKVVAEKDISEMNRYELRQKCLELGIPARKVLQDMRTDILDKLKEVDGSAKS